MNKIPFSAIIFDLDGTLLDTSNDLGNAVNYALEKNGFDSISLFEAVQFTGSGMKNLMERAILRSSGTTLSEDEFARVFEDFRSYYALHANDNTVPYKGIPELLNKLRADKIPLAVLSNKKHEATSAIIRHHFPDTFDVVLGEGGDVVKKPDTSGFSKILRELDISDPETVLYVGDSEIDVMTVKNARCRGVFVSWGFRTKEQLINAGADIILDSVASLEDHIYNK